MTTTAITYMDINKQIQTVAPVLASSFTVYPITFQAWLKPTDKVDDKHPCFVQDDTPPLTPPFEVHNLYSDYVWGTIDNGATGYYHLRTREANSILIELLENNVPNIQCECYNANKQEVIRRAEVIELLRSRLESDIPNDIYIMNEIQENHVDVVKKKSEKGGENGEKMRAHHLQHHHHDHKQGHVCSDRLLKVLRSFGSTKFPYGGVAKGI
ncbi:predicted protein [Chaetoceros tenuissimus]|uniref:Uncharacterized protein n=1 Tax=Chaetoceros tenuissimus TaxID=426638 RepID=A0AAD3CDT8_9STRA|nr:predicted protein [Chaetoceros tenuissimus]